MSNSGIEQRPQLELNPSVRAFALPREPRGGLRHFLDDLGIEEIVRASPGQTRVVIVDLRQVRYLSADTLVALIELRNRLASYPCRVVLYAEDPGLRTALLDVEMTRYCSIVGSERELVARVAELNEVPPPLTAAALTEALAAGVTLGDILRELEQAQP